MSPLYVPGPVRRPLLLRPARWSGGMSVAFLVGVAVLGVPAIYGAAILLVEIAAAFDPLARL